MKRFSIIIVYLAFAIASSAQEKRQYFAGDNWFIGARAGVVNSLAENISGITSHINPTYSLEVGKVLNREFQVRGTFGYYKQAGEASDACKALNPLVDTYHFSMLYLGADFMINITSGFSETARKFNLLPTIGVGMVRSYGFDKDVENWYIYPVDTSDRISPVFRLGLVSQIALTKSCDLSVDALWNVTSNKYNGVKSQFSTGQFFELTMGVIYHFRDTYNEYRYQHQKGANDDYWLMLRNHRKRWLK